MDDSISQQAAIVMEKKKTIFLKMECCKCHKDLGIGILNKILQSNSFIPAINKVEYHGTTLDFYCNECYVKEVLDIDL